MIYQRVKELCKQKGITITGLESTLGFARGSLSKIDKNKPSFERVHKLAEFFGTSDQYILTGVEPEKQSIDFDVKEITKAIEASLRKEMGKSEYVYYTDPETAQMAQAMYDDPDMRSLYHMKRNMSPEKFKAHMDMMKTMYKLEHPEDDDYGA